jgi:hypothetical protein
VVTKTEGEREFGFGRSGHRGKNEAFAWLPTMSTVDRDASGLLAEVDGSPAGESSRTTSRQSSGITMVYDRRDAPGIALQGAVHGKAGWYWLAPLRFLDPAGGSDCSHTQEAFGTGHT